MVVAWRVAVGGEVDVGDEFAAYVAARGPALLRLAFVLALAPGVCGRCSHLDCDPSDTMTRRGFDAGGVPHPTGALACGPRDHLPNPLQPACGSMSSHSPGLTDRRSRKRPGSPVVRTERVLLAHAGKPRRGPTPTSRPRRQGGRDRGGVAVHDSGPPELGPVD